MQPIRDSIANKIRAVNMLPRMQIPRLITFI